jgi:hypothetical protein
VAEKSDDAFERLAAALSEPEVTIQSLRHRAKPVVAVQRKPINPKPFMIAVPVLAALWLMVACVAYFPRWQQVAVFSGLYHALGAKPTDGLVFADVHMEREQYGPKTQFIITGSVRNQATSARRVPTVRVLLKDVKNNILWVREYPVNTELKAGDVYPFRITNVETALAKSVASIVVDMGNSLQLAVR